MISKSTMEPQGTLINSNTRKAHVRKIFRTGYLGLHKLIKKVWSSKIGMSTKVKLYGTLTTYKAECWQLLTLIV